MLSPFPGMDPFLEDADIWPDFHADLAVEIKRRLNRQIGPKYYAAVETQSVPYDQEVEISSRIRPDVGIYEPLDVAPDAPLGFTTEAAIPAPPLILPVALAVKLRSVRVYHTQTGTLVTTIEILSPFNKRPGSDGLMQSRLKRAQILASHVHLVELDLLRGGERPALELNDHPIDTDYILLVNRYGLDRLSGVWPVALNEALPLLPMPLLAPDPDVPLDLNAAIDEVYAGSGYAWRITYQPPVPPPAIRPPMREWVDNVLSAHAGRSA